VTPATKTLAKVTKSRATKSLAINKVSTTKIKEPPPLEDLLSNKLEDKSEDELPEDLDEDEINFSKEEWYSKIFDVKATGLCSIYSVKKSGKGKKIKIESLARYLLLNENYEIYDPLKGVSDLTDSVTYRRQLIRLLWKYLIYNTEDCREFDSEWYANTLSISQKLNRHVPSASNGAPILGKKSLMLIMTCQIILMKLRKLLRSLIQSLL